MQQLRTWAEGGELPRALAAAFADYSQSERTELFPLLDFLDQVRDRQQLVVAARQQVDAAPRDGARHLVLAYALDCDHQVRDAAEHYELALGYDAGVAYAHVLLANLRAGGNKTCDACVQAFAAAPELLDTERAAAHLLAALDHDRGQEERVLNGVVHLALELGRGAEFLKKIDALLAGTGLSNAQRERLQHTRARVARLQPRDG
jgi:hypothetical protein